MVALLTLDRAHQRRHLQPSPFQKSGATKMTLKTLVRDLRPIVLLIPMNLSGLTIQKTIPSHPRKAFSPERIDLQRAAFNRVDHSLNRLENEFKVESIGGVGGSVVVRVSEVGSVADHHCRDTATPERRMVASS